MFVRRFGADPLPDDELDDFYYEDEEDEEDEDDEEIIYYLDHFDDYLATDTD